MAEKNRTTNLIEFHGIQIEPASKDGVPFANLRRLCEELGLGYPRQKQKLEDAHWARVTIMVTRDSLGRQQEMAFISADSIPMWIANIEARRVKAEARALLDVIQDEMKDVLWQWFSGDSSSLSVNGHALASVVAQQGELLNETMRQVADLREMYREQQKISSEMLEIMRSLSGVIPKLESQISEKRQEIKTSVKHRHYRFIGRRRNGFCPCCERIKIVDGEARIANVAEMDHFWHRAAARVDEVWLVCKSCNNRLRNKGSGGFWKSKTETFIAYVEAMSSYESDQQLLPFMEKAST